MGTEPHLYLKAEEYMSLRHDLEALALRLGISLSRTLGPIRASNAGGRVMRALGPMLAASRTADLNLRLALPALSDAQRRAGVHGGLGKFGPNAPRAPPHWRPEC